MTPSHIVMVPTLLAKSAWQLPQLKRLAKYAFSVVALQTGHSSTMLSFYGLQVTEVRCWPHSDIGRLFFAIMGRSSPNRASC